MPIGESVKAHGLVDSKEAYHSSVSTLSVGITNRRDIPVLIMDCSHVSSYAESKVDGYIGHNFLEHFIVTLNYRDEFIVLA